MTDETDALMYRTDFIISLLVFGVAVLLTVALVAWMATQ